VAKRSARTESARTESARTESARTKSATVAKRGANGRKTKQALSNGDRPYRRMPEPSDIMKAYKQIGTISGLAEHFDVPHYTVTHWARRLRAQGYDIGRSS
jgi:hypothetical protein